jgi:NAD(P)-dependent dehydrogenase (short-subunit alcohol dehydrogenase family)
MSNEQRTALVTGSSKGIGRGIALELAAQGWDVFVNYNRDQAGAEETVEKVRAQGRRAWAIQADVGYSDQVDKMFASVDQEAGSLQLLVNNAAVQTWCPLLELSEEDWDRTIRTNLKGTFLCTQRAARRMGDGGGVIVNIGSGSSSRPFPKLSDYSSSKGGIDNFTRVAAVELGPLGIRVNCVAPGAIEIERTQQESPNYAGTWAPVTPMRRVGKPEDIARMVAFLARDDSDFVTGQTIYVDGGLFSQVVWPYD